jgi:hypothetical protein
MDRTAEPIHKAAKPIHDCRIYTCAPLFVRASPTGSGVEVTCPPEPSEAPRVHRCWRSLTHIYNLQFKSKKGEISIL